MERQVQTTQWFLDQLEENEISLMTFCFGWVNSRNYVFWGSEVPDEVSESPLHGVKWQSGVSSTVITLIDLIGLRVTRRKQSQSIVSITLLASQNFMFFWANERCWQILAVIPAGRCNVPFLKRKLTLARTIFSRTHHQQKDWYESTRVYQILFMRIFERQCTMYTMTTLGVLLL